MDVFAYFPKINLQEINNFILFTKVNVRKKQIFWSLKKLINAKFLELVYV